MKKIYLRLSALAFVTMVCIPASAQKPEDTRNAATKEDPRRAEAEVVFDEANRISDAGRTAEALEKYEKAYAIYPSPNTLVNIARHEQLLGKNRKAIRHYREAIRSPLLSPRGLELGKKFIAELEPSFARIDLKGPSGMVVTVGNEEVTLPLPEPLDIEPGTILATGEMHGKRYDGSATVAAGHIATIRLHAPGAAEGMALGQSQGKESEKSFWTAQHVTGVVLGGAAVVAAGLGVGFLAAHNSKASDANNFAAQDEYACNPSTTSICGKYQNAKDSAKNAKTGSIVSFVAAGALAVGAVALLVPWQQWMTKEGSRVSARVVPTGQGILIDGAF